MSGLSYAQPVSGRVERWRECGVILGVLDRDKDVDDRLGRQFWNGRRTDVLDPKRGSGRYLHIDRRLAPGRNPASRALEPLHDVTHR